MWGKNDPFQDQKGADARQIVILLGPMHAGKTELKYAIQDLTKIGENTLARIESNPDDPKWGKAEKKASHVDSTKPTTPTAVPISRKQRLFKASLYFKDGGGAEERQVERIQQFIDNNIKPKPRKWKDGVLAVVVFNLCDIIANDNGRKNDVESTYRDLVETWWRDIQKELENREEEDKLSQEDIMRGKKAKRRKPFFRPPLAVIFIGSHLDCAIERGVTDAEKQIDGFIRDMETAAKKLLGLPPSMVFPPSRTILADLVSLQGRIQFARDFYKARVGLTEVMKENLS